MRKEQFFPFSEYYKAELVKCVHLWNYFESISKEEILTFLFLPIRRDFVSAIHRIMFFFYSLHNKGVYVKMGIRKMMGRKMCKDMHKEIRLEVDGKIVELPPVEGIIILNILRYVNTTE